MEKVRKYIISENFNEKVYLNEGAGENALLAAGFLPVIGEVADIILIIKYLREKRYLEAGLMMVALIPTVGDIAIKPFLAAGKAVGAFTGTSKFLRFLNTNKKAAQTYSKFGKEFKNPILNKLINQIRKILPKTAKKMDDAANLHINLVGRVTSKQVKKGVGNSIKQNFRRKALDKYLIKTGGKTPTTFLSGWWNVVYKGRRNRRDVMHRILFGSNLLNSLGIFNIRDLQRMMSNEKDAEKLLQDPNFAKVYEQINQFYKNDSQQQDGNNDNGDFLSSMLGLAGSNPQIGLAAIKAIAGVVV